MSTVALFLAVTAVVAASGVVAWVWMAMASANEDMRSFVGFEGMHFEE